MPAAICNSPTESSNYKAEIQPRASFSPPHPHIEWTRRQDTLDTSLVDSEGLRSLISNSFLDQKS